MQLRESSQLQSVLKRKDNGRSCRNVDLDKVLAVVPCKVSREEPGVLSNTSKTTKCGAVRVDDDTVCTSLFYADSVVCEAVAWMEVEDP